MLMIKANDASYVMAPWHQAIKYSKQIIER